MMQPLLPPPLTLPMIHRSSSPSSSMDTPTFQLQDIRKRMRTGKHKYAIPGADDEKTYTNLADDGSMAASAELVGLLRLSEACSLASENDNTDTATSSSCESPIVERPTLTLSPPPTPGRDHDIVSFSTDVPKVLPLGQHFDDNNCAQSDKKEQASSATMDPSCPLPSFRLKPTFTADFLRDVVSKKPKTTGALTTATVPDVPFQFAAAVYHDTKVSAKMNMALLPPLNEVTERAIAA